MSNKKKIIIIFSMILLLAATVTLNIMLNNQVETPVDGDSDIAPVAHFANYRTDRTSNRNEQLSILSGMIEDPEVSAESKASAEAMKIEICERMDKELVIENLIKSNGFEDVVVSLNDDNINVVVDDEELTSAEVAKIMSIIMTETSYTPDMIIVYPYN